MLERGAAKAYAGARDPRRADPPRRRAAAPRGGAALNVLSVASWFHFAANGAYRASKAAAWAQTNAVREELSPAGTHVAALHSGYIDTAIAEGVPPDERPDPAVIAAAALDGIAAGATEILADEVTRSVKRRLSAAPAAA
jgi:NAD(P)-dependent dehydrogenase (short-subunit alcohol dehydrogenase family)